MSSPNDSERWKLLELFERAVDGRLSDDEKVHLEATLQQNPELRTLFAQALQQDAELRYDRGLLKDLSASPLPAVPIQKSFPVLPVLLLALLGAGVFIATGLWLGKVSEQPQSAALPASPRVVAVATLTRATHCQWAGSTLPTAEGSRIASGTLELLEGIATVKFDSGAEVVLEAPTSLEILDSSSCRLRRGTLMVQNITPNPFAVDSPFAQVTNKTARFGVSVADNGKYLIRVYDGHISILTKDTNATRILKNGETVDNGLRREQVKAQASEQESNRWLPDLILEARDGWQILSTAYGRGQDSYIQSADKESFGKDPYFRVKHTSAVPNLERKGYLGFDVARFSGKNIVDAELVLSIEPSDLGFATLTPDSRFAIYGVTDEAQDVWDENRISWLAAPAHEPKNTDFSQPMLQKATLLGKFDVAQGLSRGTRTLRGDKLVQFLKSDTNGLVTFIICRETDDGMKDGLVHAFATKESSGNTPPVLRVKTSEP